MNTQTHTNYVKGLKSLIDSGDSQAAFSAISRLASPNDIFSNLQRLSRLFSKIDKKQLKLRPLKVALLASSNTDLIADILNLWMGLEGFDVEVYSSPFDSVSPVVLDQNSELYKFKPDVVWFCSTWRDLNLNAMFNDDKKSVDEAIDSAIARTISLWHAFRRNSSALIIQNNADAPLVDILDNFAGTVPWSSRNIYRHYNLKLTEHCSPGIAILDLEHLSASFGKTRWTDDRYWHLSKHAFSFDAIGNIAFTFSRIVGASKGLAKKCLILDLDNTIWGGVIGDDGVNGIILGATALGEAYVAFQAYIRLLKERGIVLAVCSKNEESIAREPFLNHPDMRLRIEDIAVFKANWNNKADNIKAIAQSLNLGLDSMVFVDDNPVERDIVRKYLPMVCVPEMPDDPSEYVAALYAGKYFETISFSHEDRLRAEYYRANELRQQIETQFTDVGSFQQSLNMEAEVGPLDTFHFPRAVQLINKSNQFNLTTHRYTESDVSMRLSSEDWIGRYFILRDRFGDNGLISVVLMKKEDDRLVIDTWVMSCRVLSRGMEEFIANEIAELAIGVGCSKLIGIYSPTVKNKLVSELYPRLGFSFVGEDNGNTIWEKVLTNAIPLVTHIKYTQSNR